MPLALFIAAALLILTAIKGNYAAVGAQFNTTFFSGDGKQSGFIVWFGSILGIAFLFRAIGTPRAGEAFIALLLIVYFIENNGVIGNIESALASVGGGAASTAASPPGPAIGLPASPSSPAAPITSGSPAGATP